MVKVFSLTITLLITLFFLLILPNQISAATITCGGNDYDSATACPQGYQFQCNNNTPTCVNTTTCSTPTLSVEIPGSGIKINNEDPAITDSIYVSASGSCSSSANTQYFFRLRYYDDAAQRWYTQSETEWQTSNNTGFSLDSGIREYFVEAFMPNGNSTTEAGSYFYKMAPTSSTNQYYSTSAYLSWSLRMNFYDNISPTNDLSSFPFYLLVGTDSSISANRQPTTGEILVIGGRKDLDLINKRITWYTDNYYVSGLISDTTYYWRIRGLHPNGKNSYFAGGTFKTLPPNPPPTVTTNDATNVDSGSAILNGTVNPNGMPASSYFRYSQTNPGSCNDTFGPQVFASVYTTAVPYSASVSSLSPNTFYYFCAIAENLGGTGMGLIKWFRTSTSTSSPSPSPSPSPGSSPSPTPTGTPPSTTSVTTCGAEDLNLLEGLLTTPGQPVSQSSADSSKFKCIIDPKAAFAPFKIPSFDDLKSLYYTQKK